MLSLNHSTLLKGQLMKQALVIITVMACVMLTSCTHHHTEDQKFEALAKNYIEKLIEMKPEWATGLGDHRYDSKLSDYSLAGVDVDRQFNSSYLDSLSQLDPNQLSPTNKIDLKIMKTNLESWLFQIDTLKEYEWNPLAYNVGGAIYGLLAREFAPVKERLLSVKERLKGIPTILAAAKVNLKNCPKIHTETAIRQNPGTISLIRDELKTYLDQVPELKDEFAPIQAEAVKALEDYGLWLEKELLPKATGEFRLGEEKYKRKLYYSLESDLTKEDILKSAEEDLKTTHAALYKTALPLFKKFFPRVTDANKLADEKTVIKAVLDKLAETRPSNATIVDLAKEYLQKTTDFVRSSNLVTVPDEPVKVIVMPEYQRGVAVAYCDAPGPLEKNGATFYSISPTPADWTKDRVESFFREYNNFMLQNLTIHEAMPGHYLQLAHANRFKAPTMVRAIFSSGTFVEGWATYAEQLMVEKGYGGPELQMQQLKMRLRLIINSIIDQKIHTAGMTEKEAMDLMKNAGFQEEGEAAGKWRRACLTSTQLSTYYVGNTELNRLRKAYEAKHGSTVDMKTMHDAILSLGSPAPRYVKEALGL
jgi:uncharacterized protein (DUF885 family)